MSLKNFLLISIACAGLTVAGCGVAPAGEMDAGMTADVPMGESDAPRDDASPETDAAVDASDPCALCSADATCLAGACSCLPGFVGDGFTCTAEVVGLSVLDAYLKASNTGASDAFGTVALSGDGNTLAIGAVGEDSDSTGVDPAPNEDGSGSGAVYVYRRTSSGWAFEAFLKASNTGDADGFGNALSLSADGTTLAVGASLRGIGNPGGVYLFVRSGAAWSQQAFLIPEVSNMNMLFGFSVSLSADGNRLAVGAPGENGRDTGVTTLPAPGALSLPASGATFLYERIAATWAFEAYVKASNTGSSDNFGWAVSLSGDGDTLVVGAPQEDSANTGVDGTSDNSASNSGAVYVYRRSTDWAFESYIKGSEVDVNDAFGEAVSLDFDGSTLAVGAPNYQFDSGGYSNSGVVFVYRHTSSWAEQDFVLALSMGSDEDDHFGASVSLSDDGDAFAAGAPGESSSLTGIGLAMDESAPASGAVYLYRFSSSAWSRESFIKASNTDAGDLFGSSVSLSGDGTTLAVGASDEDSSGIGVGSDSDELATDSGAVYVYR